MPTPDKEAGRAARAQLEAMRARAAAKQTPAPLAVLREITARNVAAGGAIFEQTAPRTRKDQGKNPVKVSCGCRSVRVFPSALALGPITCQVCGSDFG